MQEIAEAIVVFGLLGFILGALVCAFVESIWRAESERMGAALIMTAMTLCIAIGCLVEHSRTLKNKLKQLQNMAVDAGLGEYAEQVATTKKVFIIKKEEEGK